MQNDLNPSVKVTEGKNNAFVESCFDWVGAAAVALVVVSLLFSFFCRGVNGSGEAMTNTLQNGEKLLLSGICATPKYGDVVVIRRENGTPLIKRVIGLPGDTIRIYNGKVYRNGEELSEPYVRGGYTPGKSLEGKDYTVPENGVFALGDNRTDSLDSRDLQDSITMDDVVGVVTYRLSPFESLRKGE